MTDFAARTVTGDPRSSCITATSVAVLSITIFPAPDPWSGISSATSALKVGVAAAPLVGPA